MSQATRKSTRLKPPARARRRQASTPSPREMIGAAEMAFGTCADYGKTVKAYLHAIEAIAARAPQTEAIVAIRRHAFPAECAANSMTLHAEMYADKLAKSGKKGGAQ